MLPDHQALFDRKLPPLRAGGNVRLTGANGIYTLTGEANSLQGTVVAEVSTQPGLEVYRDGQVLYVRPAAILGLIPTIGGVGIDNASPPSLAVSLSGTYYVVANISSTLNTTAYGGETFVDNATFTAVSLTLESSAPGTADLLSTTGAFKILVATVVNGKVSQNGYGPYVGYVSDNGSVNGTGQLNYTTGYP